MPGSILTETKKALGIHEEYTAFDPELIMHINSVFGTLNQLGIGPADGYIIIGKNDNWDEFIGEDKRLSPVKSYMYLRVRLLFDPPSVGFVLTAFEKQIEQAEWRILVAQEDINTTL